MPEKTVSLPRGTIVPNHIAMILDGNRRWARSKGLPTLEGHRRGFDAGMKMAEAARNWGVHTFTVWGFSTENWDRDPKEIEYLMKLYKNMAWEIEKRAKKEEIRFVHLGKKEGLPQELVKCFADLEEKTRHYKKHVFNAAINYGGKDEIVRATKKIIDSGIRSKDLDDKVFASYLDTGDQPFPYVDLFIRTSGEQRTSGFLPWQLNYAEFYWELEHLPDMSPEKLRDIVIDFSRRRRRFGGNDAVEHLKFNPQVTAKFELSWWRLRNIPEGVKFRDYAINHLREQFGLSKELAKDAAKLLVESLIEEKDSKFDKSLSKMKKFYQLIKGELKLAFEPKIVASLEVKMRRELNDNRNSEAEETAKELYAEVYRISLFQAAKAAHLRVLAAVERNLAEKGMGEAHWAKAEDYLHKYYQALKERVA